MRAIIWWLRSAFCKHEWTHVHDQEFYRFNIDGKQIGELPARCVRTKECSKCGWIWRQDL